MCLGTNAIRSSFCSQSPTGKWDGRRFRTGTASRVWEHVGWPWKHGAGHLCPLHLGSRWASGGAFPHSLPPVEASGGKPAWLIPSWVSDISGPTSTPALWVFSSVSSSLILQQGRAEVSSWEGRREHASLPFLFLLKCQCQQLRCFAFLKPCSHLRVQ